MSEPFDEAAWRAAIRERLGPWLASPKGQRSIANAVQSGLKAIEQEDRRRIIHGDDVEPSDEPRFARSLAAYARCQDECQDRRAGDPECRDACRRAHVSGRKA